MSLRYINSIALLFYGYQTELLWFAVPMALAWEAQFFINRRWALGPQDFYQAANLTGLALVAILIFLFTNRGEYHPLTSLIRWLPMLFYPLILLLDFSTTSKLSLDILFYPLRRQAQPVSQVLDHDYLLFGLALVAAGATVDGDSYYFYTVFILLLLVLLKNRPRRYSLRLWTVLGVMVLVLAIGLHVTIAATHLELKQRAQEWLGHRIRQRNNAFSTRTEIGRLGRLKLSDKILFRVRLNGPSPGLLQEATYDLPTGNSWTVMNPAFAAVSPEEDFTWRFGNKKTDFSADIYLGFANQQALVPVPPGVLTLSRLPATELQSNQYATLRGYGLVNTSGYQVEYQIEPTMLGRPAAPDTYLPEKFATLLEAIPALASMNRREPLLALQDYFSDFGYRLHQDTQGEFKAFSRFLTTTRAGHCEYFATAAVLILRKMGIPARYTVGYALKEYNPLLDMYLVRRRHAHAWATAFIHGRWQVVDMTPSAWAGEEAKQAIFLQPLFDLLSNLLFVYKLWWHEQDMDDYEWYLYLLGGVLVLVFGFRIYASEQVVVDRQNIHGTAPRHPASESELYNLESLLNEQGYVRNTGEGFTHWFQRLGLGRLVALVPTHNRWRFDPAGLDEADKIRFQNKIKKIKTRMTSDNG